MEINLIPVGDNPHGALAVEDIVEGRCVLLTSHTWNEGFGSLVDLPGVKTPDNSTEALRARYIVTWTVPDRTVSPGNVMFVPTPSMDFALRGGFDQAANLPMVGVTVRVTWPGNQESVTIPSGTKVLLLGDGAVVTVPSGQYVYSADVETPGALLEVLNANDDAAADVGKLSYSATGTIAEVVRFNSSTAALTVRMLGG